MTMNGFAAVLAAAAIAFAGNAAPERRPAPSPRATAASSGETSERKMVWAHYVPWHTPDNLSLTQGRYYNWPHDDVTDTPYEDELRRAMAMGIDGFFFDVTAKKGSTSYSDLSNFLKAAEGTDFMCAVCLDVKTDVANQIGELEKMIDLNSRHPNYARFRGKPVVATYTFLQWTPEEWREIREGLRRGGRDMWLIANLGRGYKAYDERLIERYADVFDAAYFFGYNIVREPSISEMNRRTAALCDRRGSFYMPCVGPGYYGAWLNGRNDFYQPYRGLDTAQDRFEAAMGISPQWLHLTTWNDHCETSFCPRRLTPGCASLVRAWADELKDAEPPARADVVFAYHREEFAGTLARFEAMRLPSRDGGSLKLGLRLLDASGAIAAELPAKTLSGKTWERVEWLVPTAELAYTPVLVPQAAMKDGEGVRRADLPPLFLVRGWLEDAETVRVSFGDCAPGEASLAVECRGGRVWATLEFAASAEVKRAILMRNGRPLAQFAPGDAEGEAQLALSVAGGGLWGVEPAGGRVVSARRQFCKNDPAGKFRWNERAVKSYATPLWSKGGALVAGGESLELVLSGNKEKRRISAWELANLRTVSAGGFTFTVSPDPTVQTRRPWNAKSGKAKLALFDRPPKPTDVYWVRMECVDGRAFASRPVWPFCGDGGKAAEADIVETPVTIERTSGASGIPNVREFIASYDDLPVKETRVVRRAASPLTVRRAEWRFDGTGVNEYGDRMVTGIPASAYVEREGGGKALKFDGKGSVKPRLPLRVWPSGPATISFDVNPSPFDGRRQDIAVRLGWMDAISVRITEDGRVEAERSAFAKSDTVVLRGKTPMEPGKWTCVTVSYDGRAMRILLDGRLDAEGECGIARVYGNLTVVLGGDGASAFNGLLDNLAISGETALTDLGVRFGRD